METVSLNSHHTSDGFEEGGRVVADAVFEDGFGFAEIGDGFVGVAIYDHEVGGFPDFNGAGLVCDAQKFGTVARRTFDGVERRETCLDQEFNGPPAAVAGEASTLAGGVGADDE